MCISVLVHAFLHVVSESLAFGTSHCKFLTPHLIMIHLTPLLNILSMSYCLHAFCGITPHFLVDAYVLDNNEFYKRCSSLMKITRDLNLVCRSISRLS
ncbi:hypothetical protein EV127DRAFT_19234 [Xylaria flabelliformis]|nr:hypothetical protein EV127DRAFT_19234 [Xylaria flabelliformis]